MKTTIKSLDELLDTTAAAFVLIGLIAIGTSIVGQPMTDHEHRAMARADARAFRGAHDNALTAYAADPNAPAAAFARSSAK